MKTACAPCKIAAGASPVSLRIVFRVLQSRESRRPIRACGAPWPAWPPTPMPLRPCSSACAAARAVAPVVKMSSISRMCFMRDGGRIGNRECAAHIQPPLARRQAGLALGGAQPHQRARGQREPPLRMASCAGHRSASTASERAWLKPRWAYFERCSGTGTTSISAGRFAGQLGDGLGQHPAQPAGRRMQPVVLERVDGRLHAALVRPVGHGPHKRRRRQAAGPAERGTRRAEPQRRVKRVAAARAHGSALDGKLRPADIANWHGRKLRQRGAAESTGGRKEGATQGVHGTSKHASHCAPTGSLRWRNVERQ